ncbi:MAG: hypothetical protein E6H07_14335 [Bacteroidetes bacterium]|nr:MAG: hypothetical protein E6H07_14335 [Bacteroidota bacterium]
MAKFLNSALLILTLYSCQTHQMFDKKKWAEVGDLMTFPKRKSMVDDLTKNIPLKGKSYQDIISLLGQPQHSLDSTMNIGYKIDEDYGNDIDPIYTQTLLLHFDKDSTVNSFEVKEWKK